MVNVGRVSTLATFNNTIQNVRDVQTSLFNTQNQISSGLKTDNFEGLVGQAEQFVQLEGKIKKSILFQEKNAVNIARLQSTNVSLDQVINIADDMENLMVLRRNVTFADSISFEQQMRGYVESLAVELNATFEGRFLFGGTRTNVQPIITEPFIPEPIELGVLDDGYYQGSKENYTLRADENLVTDVNVRADAEGFQGIFGAAFLAIEGHGEDDDDLLVDAIDMIQEGLKEVIAIQSSVNSDILNLQNISERQETLQLYWQGVTEEVANTDVLAASTKLAVDQTVLQASFQAFSVVNSLRLVDYL
ncbi:MAG: hypothetical protein MRY32_07560 [Rickettsiales bacterium]|nr:hypothetical protein [Rickettsiales bacterium]